jgi:methionyl-tRNA formyltransferase
VEANTSPGAIRQIEKNLYVVCGEGTCLLLESLQIEGRKKTAAQEFANGARMASGERFG